MKISRLIILPAVFVAFIACNQNSDKPDDKNQSVSTKQDSQNEATATDAKESKTSSEGVSDDKSSKTETGTAPRMEYKLSELKNGSEIDGMPVSGYFYEPRDEYYFDLSGERILEGKLHKDPMSGMPAIMVENEELKQIKLIVNGQKLPIFTYIQISNEADLKSAMDDSMLESYNAEEKLPVKIKVKGFTQGGKIDGYGGTNTEFVAFE